MAVLGRLLVSSAERLDLPDLLSLDSYAAGDWKYFLKGLVGDSKPFILKGFDVIDPGNAIGTQSCSIRVADSVTFYPGSNSGSFFHGLQEGHPQAAPLVPELRKNAVNYVYLTFSTFNTSVDTRAFWDPDKDGGAGGEFTQDINTESVLQVQVNVSTGSFPANTIPIAKITVGPVVITAIEDARDLMFRLGSGGINPNPFNSYAWRTLPGGSFARQEPPTTMLAGGVNPFQGADKNILTLKEWMDAIMSKLRELGGTTYWYDDTSSFSIITNFYDSVATAFKSKGKWVHDTVTPGLLTWTEDIQIKMTSDPRTYILRQGSEQLANEQVMYLAMQRNLPFNVTDESVSWINGQVYVNTIGGAVGLFANLSKGDYIKKANDTIDKWVRVEEFYDAVNLGGSTTTAAGARSVRLSSPYLGVTLAEKGRYDKGAYLSTDVIVSDRNQAAISNVGGNFHWLAMRSDTIENIGNVVTTNLSLAISEHDGQTAKVTSVGHGLVDGDRLTIAGTTNFDGTYQVEVETANIFYITISGGPFADESGTGHYAVVTTTARSTPYGFQEESANHGFNSNDTISIDGTTNYDGSYEINVLSATSFNIATPGPAATETVGTATLAKVIVRTEGAVAQLIQGQVVDIGGDVADNIRLYVGMDSFSQTAPIYSIPSGYNTLDGMQNYNSIVNENLTVRVAKLTAMMADKAQDKTILALPSSGITSINNTTNGLAQEITFTPNGASLTFITPGSNGQYILPLPGSAPGISLLENQVAYVEIDRNNPTNVGSFTVADIVDVPISENIFIIASRLLGNDVYLWEGSIIATGGTPGPGYINTIVRQNQTLKLVAGGTWSLTATPAIVPLINNSDTTGSTAGDHIVTHQPANTWLVYNFTVTGTKTISDVAFYLQRASGTGNINAVIATDTGTGPGSILFTSAPVAVAGISNIAHTVTTFSFSGATLSAGNYCVYIPPTASLILTTPGYSTGTNIPGPGYTTNNAGVSYTSQSTGRDYFVVNSVGVAALELTNSAAAYMQIPGLANSVNEISAQTITLNTDEVAYVDINRVGPGGILTVNTALNASLAMNSDRFIIAREDDGDVIVGNHSMRLIVGESKKLYAGASDQNLSAIGLTNEADKGDLRILQQIGGASKRIIISPIDSIVSDGTTWGNEISGLRMKFDGIQIDMQTGQYYGYGDGTLAGSGALIGSAFTPVAFTSPNLFRWYSINLVADTLGSDGTMNVKPLILSGTAGTSSANAQKAPFSSKKIGQVLVQATGTGSTINNISQSNVVQLSAGAGSGGSGGAPKLIGGGTFSWDTATNSLSFTSNIFVEQARLNYADNTINQASVSPIVLPSTNHVAFIDRLNASSGGPNLTVIVDLITNVKDGQIIIARRDGNDVIVGSTSTRLRDGESAQLFAPRSLFSNQDQTAKLIEGGTWFHNNSSTTTSGNIYTSTGSGSAGFTTFPFVGLWAGANWITTSAFDVTSVTYQMNNAGVAASGNATVRLYSDSAGSPGTLLATSNPFNVGSMSGSPQPVTFTFGTPISLANATRYHFLVDADAVTNAGSLDLIRWGSVSDPNLGSVFTLNSGSTWSIGTLDLMFTIAGNTIVALDRLEWSSDAFIQIPGLANTRNRIAAGNLTLTNGQVAYVDVNRKVGATATLTPTVVATGSYIQSNDRYVIARRENNTHVIGDSMLLTAGESKALYAGVSNQLLNVIPAASNSDSSGQLRLLQNASSPKRVNVSSVSKTVPDGTEYGIQIKNLLLDFAGAQIDFSTGSIFAADGTTPLGINFTPATIAANQYRWYSITLVPNAVTGVNKISGQLIIVPGAADGASAALAPRAAFASTGIRLGEVVVQQSGANIANILQSNIVQLSATGGGDGSGDANELLERLKDRLIEAPFEWVDPNIFLVNEDNKIDTATATFDVANTLYDFNNIGDNIVSINALDPEFITEEKDLDSVELMAFWDPSAIDANATYEVSRNGGVDWETMDMSRVGSTTETFRGILKFPADTTYSVLSEWAVANATSYRELNASTLQSIGQIFAVTANEAWVAQRTILYINKVGAPVGTILVQLVRDNAGSPSTSLLDVVAQKQVFASSLAAGDNAITLNWGTNVIPAGDYHIVIATDAGYKAGFSSGVNSVRARVDATAPLGPNTITEFNGTVWAPNVAQSLIYRIEGRELDLRVRITSSAANVLLKGYGIYYGRQDQIVTGIKNREVQNFDGTIDNLNEFTITNFLPDSELLKVYHVQTGQVYVYGTNGFSLDGHKVVFPVDTFDGLGSVTLVFDQLVGASFDNSDSNAALLTANFLGSTDPSIDRSQNGRGILLRRPDGTLREITLDNSDNIVILSVP